MSVFAPKSFEDIMKDMQTYILSIPESNLTDFRTGSNLSVFLGAVAEKIEELDGEMFLGWRAVAEWACFKMFQTLQRKQATYASGSVIFSKGSDTNVVTIPVGTSVSSGTVTFTTTREVSFSGTDSSLVPIVANIIGLAGNVGIREINQFSTTLPAAITSVYNLIATSGGADEEGMDEFSERFSVWAKSLGRNNVYTISTYAMMVDGVHSVSVRENYPDRGDVTIYIEDGSGSASPALLDTVKQALETDMIVTGGIKPAGIQYLYMTPELIYITLNIALTFINSYSPAGVTLVVEQVLTNLINAKNIGIGYIFSETLALVQSVEGVKAVKIISPSVDIDVNSHQIIRLGNIQVTSYL